ncbi:MAG: hypothetical protein OXF82_05765, partial [Gammaproteobacteria bacterium]|nr:hypothetical protein [Gammaproteobacteria bacterium]
MGEHELKLAPADAAAEFLPNQQLQIFFIVDNKNFDRILFHDSPSAAHSPMAVLVVSGAGPCSTGMVLHQTILYQLPAR